MSGNSNQEDKSGPEKKPGTARDAMTEQSGNKSQNAGDRGNDSAYEKAEFDNIESSSNSGSADAGSSAAVARSGSSDDEKVDMNVILDVPVVVSMEIGRTRIPIRNLLRLNRGSVLELDRLAGEPLDILVNGTLVAHGEVVVVNEKYGIRLTDIISPSERVRKLT